MVKSQNRKETSRYPVLMGNCSACSHMPWAFQSTKWFVIGTFQVVYGVWYSLFTRGVPVGKKVDLNCIRWQGDWKRIGEFNIWFRRVRLNGSFSTNLSWFCSYCLIVYYCTLTLVEWVFSWWYFDFRIRAFGGTFCENLEGRTWRSSGSIKTW